MIKKIKSKVLCFIILQMFAFTVFAQNITVKGRITNETGDPLSGASLVVKGANNQGTTTNAEGDFSLSVSRGETLMITAIDYSPKEIKINRADLGNISLTRSDKSLGEVVVIGYGTQRKEAITGSKGIPSSTMSGSSRPFNIAYFSEFYFVAAEAAVKGATTTAGMDAKSLINVIRARAGMWRFDNNGNSVKIEDHSADMIAATPATIDINYILAERSREYYGEGQRWFDLVRTQTWADLASTYRICGPNNGDHTPLTVTRNIQPFLYLRPIPQGQLDGMQATDADKAAYQNPGY